MTHNWKIYDLERIISDGLVTNVTYACESGFEGTSTRKIGDLTLSGSADAPGFIPYADLTESDVLGWVSSIVDEPAIETLNSASIASQIVARTAITSSTGTPW
jgi:hypothetical protein